MVDSAEPVGTAGPDGELPPKVALIDDHELVLEGLSRTLTRAGFDVVGTFIDGESALQYLAAHPADLVVVDLRLAERTGLSAITAIRQLCPQTRVAVLTSYHDEEAAGTAMRAGARGFLLKDTPSSELIAMLWSVAQGNLVFDARVSSALSGPPPSLLSEQELAILEAVAEGLTNREIGARLHLSHHTIKDYLTKAMRKLGTTRRAETVTKAAQQGLLRWRS